MWVVSKVVFKLKDSVYSRVTQCMTILVIKSMLDGHNQSNAIIKINSDLKGWSQKVILFFYFLPSL